MKPDVYVQLLNLFSVVNECETEGICGHKGICTDTLDSYICTCDEVHIGGGEANPCQGT